MRETLPVIPGESPPGRAEGPPEDRLRREIGDPVNNAGDERDSAVVTGEPACEPVEKLGCRAHRTRGSN
jgi:hypothetical protein